VKALVAALVLLAAPACSTANTSCTDIAVPGLTVYVVDATTGAPICDATVTATAGTYVETLQVTTTASGCSYAGAWERPDTYSVAITAPGYATFQKDGVVVPAGVCHVSGQTLSFEMS
jgi:hypothetical protein